MQPFLQFGAPKGKKNVERVPGCRGVARGEVGLEKVEAGGGAVPLNRTAVARAVTGGGNGGLAAGAAAGVLMRATMGAGGAAAAAGPADSKMMSTAPSWT